MPQRPKIAVNGFGRIGRLLTRGILERDADVDIVAINDLSTPEVLAHLLKHDTVHGAYRGDIEVKDGNLVFDGDELKVLHEPKPENLPWGDLDVDYVFEASGRFRKREDLEKHVKAGAERVILTAPAKGAGADVTVVPGVNLDTYDPRRHRLVSVGSCTTNCLAPVLKVLHDSFTVDHAVMTTVHAYTNDQVLLDKHHSDFRRARAAAENMLPTSTGAASTIGQVMPELDGKVSGLAVRVPVAAVSLLDLTARIEADISVQDLADAFRNAANGELKGILRAEESELVSSDFIHDPASAVVDLPSLMVVDTKLVKVLAWYDNEWAYALRCVDVMEEMLRQEPRGT